MISSPTTASLWSPSAPGSNPGPNTLPQDLEDVLRAIAAGTDLDRDPALTNSLKNLQAALGVTSSGRLDAETAQALQGLLALISSALSPLQGLDPELALQAMRQFQGGGAPNRAPMFGTPPPPGSSPAYQLQQQHPAPPPGSSDAINSTAAASINSSGTNGEKLKRAMTRAKELGLTVTSTTGGKHAAHSYHYQGRAIDVAGDPKAMAQFYREMKATNPTELFYDPLGGIKRGQEIGAIGGHSDHVHVAY